MLTWKVPILEPEGSEFGTGRFRFWNRKIPILEPEDPDFGTSIAQGLSGKSGSKI
jgi:hypothetical protein